MKSVNIGSGVHWALLVCSAAVISACSGGGGGDGDGGNSGDPTVTVQTPVDSPVGEFIPPEDLRVIPTEKVKPYRPQSAIASALAECALNTYENPCTLGKLPYIGQVHASPSVEDIVQRLLVTHDWMGVRFERMLREMPSDILSLFSPVTFIVIGSEVRPSSFSPSLGRIQLDPSRLWLSVDEKTTVATSDDYRSNFGADLQFIARLRLSIGDRYAWKYFSLTDDSERTTADIEVPLASLLYHELAHANDYVQSESLAGLTGDMTPRDAFTALEDSRVSALLYQDESLTAQRSYLYGLAGVRYFDDTPTEFQKSLQADFVGSEMANEGKTVFYSYSTIREDVAELFEATMMKYHYDVEYHIGFTNKPDNYPDSYCNDFKVSWGERNRLASALVAPRAKFVVDSIMPPSAVLDQFFATGLGQAIPLREGDGWCDSRFLSPQLTKRSDEVVEWDIFQIQDHVTR